MKTQTQHLLNLAGLTAILFCTPALPAAESASGTSATNSPLMRFLTRDYLLGDWGGRRTALSQRGVDFEFVYFGAMPGSIDGGIKDGTVYQGVLLGLLDLDSEKLLHYAGGRFHFGGLLLHGDDHFSDEHIGDLNKVSLIDFPNGQQLWEAWYEHRFLDNKVSFKVGQMAIDQDFIAAEFYNSLASISFLNQTFFYPTLAFNVWDQPFFPVGRHALASTPYGAPGIRLRLDPCEHAYFQVGAYDGNPDRRHSGTDFELSNDEGALLYFELGLKRNQTKDATGLPGNLKLGGYYHTDDFYDMYEGSYAAVDNYLATLGAPGLGVFPNPRTRQGNFGLYFLVDQTLWRESTADDAARQGLTGFFRVAYAPEDRNLTSFGIDGGLVYKGAIPSRDWDTIGLGASYLEMSGDVTRAQRDINGILTGFGLAPAFSALADYEAAIELSYKAQLTAWWTMQLSLQRTMHPGGHLLADIPDSWGAILQTSFRF